MNKLTHWLQAHFNTLQELFIGKRCPKCRTWMQDMGYSSGEMLCPKCNYVDDPRERKL